MGTLHIDNLIKKSLEETTDRLLPQMRQFVNLHPKDHGSRLALAHYLYRLNRLEEALFHLVIARNLNSTHLSTLNLLGVVRRACGHNADALELFDEVLSISPEYLPSSFNRANTLRDLGEMTHAISAYQSILSRHRDHGDSYVNLVDILIRNGDLDEALIYAEKFLKSCPLDWRTNFLLGNIFRAQKEPEKALQCYQSIPAAFKESAELNNNIAACFAEIGQYGEAERHYHKSIATSPQNWEYHFNLAVLYLDEKKYEKSIAHLEQAIALNPKDVKIFNALGRAHYEQGDIKLASEYFEKALTIDSDCHSAILNLAICYRDTSELSKSAPLFRKLLKGKNESFVRGHYLFNQLRACDWGDYESTLNAVINELRDGIPCATPFITVVSIDDPLLQRRASELYYQSSVKQGEDVLSRTKESRKNSAPPWKIGYFSADFHDHATSYLIAEVLEKHDHSEFETYGFSLGALGGDVMTERLKRAFTCFYDLFKTSDEEIQNLAMSLNLDLAIDLKGYTKGARPKLFSKVLATKQINFLGFPGTIGNPKVQYLIADEVVIPEDSKKYFSENILYVAPCYQPNDGKRARPRASKSRSYYGIPEDAFVLCSFNNSYKLTPTLFDVWMEILLERPRAVLWLLGDNPYAQSNLEFRAEYAGVDPSRIVFARRCGLEEHLERHHYADLFVDTYPCSAHTTASDCLWMGLPLLTLQGRSMASRVASSLLSALGLTDLITTNISQYKAMIIYLIDNPEVLPNYRALLKRKLRDHEIFSGEAYCRKLEAAYRNILLDSTQ